MKLYQCRDCYYYRGVRENGLHNKILDCGHPRISAYGDPYIVLDKNYFYEISGCPREIIQKIDEKFEKKKEKEKKDFT